MCILIKYYVCFNKMFVSSVVKYVLFYSKVNFIRNITNFIRIHTFYFYNNKHKFINTDIIFTTKHTNFYQNQYRFVAGPKCFPTLDTDS